MKIDVTKEDLQSALNILTPITNARSPMMILTHLLFEAGEELFVTSTNIEIGAKIKVPATITEPGNFTLLGSKCSEIVASMPNETLTFSNKDKSINLSCGRTSFLLQTQVVEDYPVFADLGSPDYKDIKTDFLLSVLDNVLFAASNDDSRFNLNSLYFTDYNNNPCIVATDGHRLALQYATDLPLPKTTMIPKSGCDFIKKFLVKAQVPDLKIASDTKNVILSTDNAIVTVRLIEGDYPDVGRVIPTVEPEAKILANIEEFKQVVKRVSLMTDNNHKGLNITITGSDVEVATNNSQLGSASDYLSVTKTGVDCTFIMNAAYLLEALNSINGDTCQINFIAEGKPVVFQGENVTDIFSLVMPLRN